MSAASPAPGPESPLGALLSRACGRAEGGRVSQQDREAAFAELLRLVMISVRAGMGRRLRDHRESADICQSVAKSFVDDYDRGVVAFESEAQLVSYLQRTVRSKLADAARHDNAQKRAAPGPATSTEPAALGANASTIVRAEEAGAAVLAGLSDEEQAIVRLRRQGLPWDEVARMLGKDPVALRRQFSRIQERFKEL